MGLFDLFKKKKQAETVNAEAEASFEPMAARELEVIIPPEIHSQESTEESEVKNDTGAVKNVEIIVKGSDEKQSLTTDEISNKIKST